MVIDIHTHAFPDAMAPKALDVLCRQCKNLYKPVTDLTIAGLKAYMKKSGVSLSVVQPVVTRPTQVAHVLDWAKQITDNEQIISFGGIFPDESYKQAIDRVVELGLKGIKLHPEYQNFVVDDDKYLPMYDYALNKGLILLFHAGYDPAFPPPFKSSPKQFKSILKKLGGGNIILAHLGGHAQWDDVEEYLVGEAVFLDTSMGQEYYSKERFLSIVNRHGANKILFGSDSPWSDAEQELKHLRSLDLSEQQLRLILGGNAQKLLGLQEK